MREIERHADEKSLPAIQERAISALLTSPSVRQAAAAVGMSEATVYRYLRLATFQTRYRQARRQLVQLGIVEVQSAVHEAVATLRDIMNDHEAPANARVGASRAVIVLAMGAVALEDVEVRIGLLETLEETRRAH